MRSLRVARVHFRRLSRAVRSIPARSGWTCLWRRRHDSVRSAIGGRRCRVCGLAGSDLFELGEMDGSGYVTPTRRVFTRTKHGGELTRTSAWAPNDRRGW